jgi:hypothetical protein
MSKKELESVKNFKKSVLSPLIKVGEGDVITRTNCKLCNSSLRFECEENWEENEFNYAKTLRWYNERVDQHNLTKDAGEEDLTYLSMTNMRNHMKSHYREQERQLRLKSYARDIESLLDVKKEKMDILDFALAACQENLARVASVETYGSLKGEKERSDAINKVIAQILNVIKAQNEMIGEMSAIDIVQEKVAQIWIQMIGEEENEAKKRIYVNMLEEFSVKFKELETND